MAVIRDKRLLKMAAIRAEDDINMAVIRETR
jgi:hypothetical protein